MNLLAHSVNLLEQHLRLKPARQNKVIFKPYQFIYSNSYVPYSVLHLVGPYQKSAT